MGGPPDRASGGRLNSPGAFRGAQILGEPTLMTLPIVLALLLRIPTQEQGSVSGVVRALTSGAPLGGATVSLESTLQVAVTDAEGRFRIAPVAPGRYTVRAVHIGYAPTRLEVMVSLDAQVQVELRLTPHPLRLPDLDVSADPSGHAADELGTATIIAREAIREHGATSLIGLLDMIPGVEVRPPGIDRVEQIALHATTVGAPLATGGTTVSGPTAEQIASFGTAIFVDGIPLSNNANLQSLGNHAELGLPSSAGGGIDLRRIPASTLERVEVIRGIPSPRFGDLTQGAILAETRTAAAPLEVIARRDEHSTSASAMLGFHLGHSHTAGVAADAIRTFVDPGLTEDASTRRALQLGYRYELASHDPRSGAPRFLVDTRLDGFQVSEKRPERPEFPNLASRSEDRGGRLSSRLRWQVSTRARLEGSLSVEATAQRSTSSAPLLRGAEPFTDRLTPGRSIGGYVGGLYVSRVRLDGDPRLFHTRWELARNLSATNADREARLGIELRRESNHGQGLQFDIAYPPQASFNGVNGYDRPRSFDSIPPLVLGAGYAQIRYALVLLGRPVEIQGGVRADALFSGTSWFSAIRDFSLQPRLNLESYLGRGLRLRLGYGHLAKAPPLLSLWPAHQYFDVVNVNYFANTPAERLAVLTTYVKDPTNPDLGFAVAHRGEVSLELLGSNGPSLSLTAFLERMANGFGTVADPAAILREHFALRGAVPGSGKPPEIIEPASSVDTVAVIRDVPSNNTAYNTHGIELTAQLPTWRALRLRVVFLGSWTFTEVNQRSIEFGPRFAEFQLDSASTRFPYWNGIIRRGQKMLLSANLIHHRPGQGLVVSALIQVTTRLVEDDVGATDPLSFAGYVSKDAVLHPIPLAQRGSAAYADLRLITRGSGVDVRSARPDWILDLRITKDLPFGGRLSAYAFNAFSRIGQFGTLASAALLYPAHRFGLELSVATPGFPR
jgi:Carboxypeptidase regulatory-like domain/TonB-dependent Receptor Plug Domain